MFKTGATHKMYNSMKHQQKKVRRQSVLTHSVAINVSKAFEDIARIALAKLKDDVKYMFLLALLTHKIRTWTES